MSCQEIGLSLDRISQIDWIKAKIKMTDKTLMVLMYIMCIDKWTDKKDWK